MLRPLIILTLFALVPQAQAMEFSRVETAMLGSGPIEEGDYFRFLDYYLASKEPPSHFAFDSVGGNLVEALAIGALVHETRTPVWVNGQCRQTCALIYLAGAVRQARGEIDLPSLKILLDGLPYKPEAVRVSDSVIDVLQRYLADMGVEQQLIDDMRSIPADKTLRLAGIERTALVLGAEPMATDPWRVQRCGLPTPEDTLNLCADHWSRLGHQQRPALQEQLKKDPIGAYRASAPTLCYPVAVDAYRHLQERQKRYDEVIRPRIEEMQRQHADVQAIIAEMTNQAGNPASADQWFGCIGDAQDAAPREFFQRLKKPAERTRYRRQPLDLLHERYPPHAAAE